MPSVPAVTLTVVDGGLGAVPGPIDRVALVMGVTSAGTVATPTVVSSPTSLISQFGYGPGVSLGALIMQVAGVPVIFAREDSSVGSTTAVTPAVGNTSSSVMTVANDASTGPFDTYDAVVTVVRAGTIGTDPCTVSISLDGGVNSISGTFALTIATPGVVHIPNSGLKVSFGAGTLVAGDSYTFATNEPTATTGDLEDCLDAFGATQMKASLIIDAGSWTAGNFATFQTDVEALTGPNAARYMRFLAGAPRKARATSIASWVTTIEAAFVATSGLRIGASAGLARTADSTLRNTPWRPLSWAVAARMVSTGAHVSAARVASGALEGVSAVDYDERTVGGLNASRFIVAKTDPDLTGFYCCLDNLMSPPGSDYATMPFGRVMDKICSVTRPFFLRELNDTVRLNSNGTILEKDAQGLEGGCQAALAATVGADGDVSSTRVVVSRSQNIASTKILPVTVSAVPLGYIQEVDVTLQFAVTAAV